MSKIRVDKKRKSFNGLFLTEGDIVTNMDIQYVAVYDKSRGKIVCQRREEYGGSIKEMVSWTGHETIQRHTGRFNFNVIEILKPAEALGLNGFNRTSVGD